MPKIPTYDNQQVFSQPLRLPYARYDTRGAFGEGIAKGINDIANVGFAIADDMDKTEAKTRLRQLSENINDLTHLGPNAYYKQGGINAMNGRQQVITDIDDRRKKLAEGLSSGAQRYFNEQADNLVLRERGVINNHYLSQRKVWESQETTAFNDNLIADYSLRPDEFDDGARNIAQAIAQQAMNEGWGKEQYRDKVRESLSTLSSQGVKNLMATDPAAAAEHLAKVESYIDPKILAPLKTAVEQRNDLVWAQNQADSLLSSDMTPTEQLNHVRDITKNEPEKRKVLESIVTSNISKQRTLRIQEQHDIADGLMRYKLESGKSGREVAIEAGEEFDKLDYNQQALLLNDKRNIESDRQIYHAMNGVIAMGDKQEAQEALQKMGRYLSDGDYQKFSDKISKIGSSAYKPLQENDMSAFKTTFESVFGDAPKDSEKLQAYVANQRYWMGVIDEQRQRWMEENPGKVWPARERDSLLAEMAYKDKRPGDVFGNYWQDDTNLTEIPPSQLLQIEQQLRDAGQLVTPKNILSRWTKQLREAK